MDRFEPVDAETVEDALDVLRDLVLWELTPERWARLQEILERVDEALTAGDGDSLREAITDLELNGPERIIWVGSAAVTGIQPKTLERQNELVHRLVDERSRQRTGAEPTRDDRGDEPAR
ncbi:CATRA system-associated protein [Micromonospora sp. NPDC004704]